tara:strand:- start:615 stop:809 length:195 start_codon:yes stop_codon:yes gene_type:complete
MSKSEGIQGKFKIMVMKDVTWETVGRFTDGKDAYDKIKELQLKGDYVRIITNQDGQSFDSWHGK